MVFVDNIPPSAALAPAFAPSLSLISSKPPCIIVDIDGTLADGSHRSHHVRRTNPDGSKRKPNWTAYNETMEDDVLIPEVRSLVMAFHGRGTVIVLCSGREGCEIKRPKTERWITKHQIPHNDLFMRVKGDYRSDDIVKEEILDNLILPKYTPLFAVDDRKRVKRMWVRRGIFVFDVNQHDEEF